jgi:hypothetical protein
VNIYTWTLMIAAAFAIGLGALAGLALHYLSTIAAHLATIAAKLEQRRVERQDGQLCENCGDRACPGLGDHCSYWRPEEGK